MGINYVTLIVLEGTMFIRDMSVTMYIRFYVYMHVRMRVTYVCLRVVLEIALADEYRLRIYLSNFTYLSSRFTRVLHILKLINKKMFIEIFYLIK